MRMALLFGEVKVSMTIACKLGEFIVTGHVLPDIKTQ